MGVTKEKLTAGRASPVGALLRGLGALGVFAHPAPRADAGAKSVRVARSLAGDWDRLGADFRKVVDRARPSG